MAEIQRRLGECSAGVQRACDAAYSMLRQDWLPRVAYHLRVKRDSYELEEVLTTVMADLMSPPPRALAPEGVLPQAWRNKVLRNATTDILRKKIRHREIERYGGAVEYSADEVRALRKENARQLGISKGVEGATEEDQSLLEAIEVTSKFREAGDVRDDYAEDIDRRKLLRTMLPKLAIRKRQAFAVDQGYSPWLWLEELADTLKEPYENVKARVEQYERAPHDLELKARVFYPEGDATKAKNAYRKLVANAMKDLSLLASEGRSA